MWYELVYNLTIKPRLRWLKKVFPEGHIHPVGSRYICNPPILSTDIDFLMYSKKYSIADIEKQGFKMASIQYLNNKHFTSFRRGKINLVFVDDAKSAENFLIATHISKLFNLTNKESRVAVHELLQNNLLRYYVVDGNDDLKMLIDACRGMHGHAFKKAFMAKHGLKLLNNGLED